MNIRGPDQKRHAGQASITPQYDLISLIELGPVPSILIVMFPFYLNCTHRKLLMISLRLRNKKEHLLIEQYNDCWIIIIVIVFSSQTKRKYVGEHVTCDCEMLCIGCAAVKCVHWLQWTHFMHHTLFNECTLIVWWVKFYNGCFLMVHTKAIV